MAPAALASLLLRGETDAARTVLLDQFRRGRPMDELLDRLVAPALVVVGDLWASGAIDVHAEHIATLHAWGILRDLRDLVAAPPRGAPLALGAAPEGDPYLLPCVMAEMTLADLGWATVSSGPHTPLPALAQAVRTHRPRLVWLSMAARDGPPGFVERYAELREAARAAGASVMLGGQGLTPELQDGLVASAFGTRLAHLRAFAETLARR